MIFPATRAQLLACALLAGPAPRLESESFSWSNPIRYEGPGPERGRNELRDPCILREGGLYYLVYTVFPFTHHTSRDPSRPDCNSSPGIKLFSSPDLKTWTFVKWLVKSSELPEDCPYKHRFWAPEIHKMNGKFYLIFTADNWIRKEYNPGGDNGLWAFVGVSDKVAGPYEHITWINGAACDTTLLGDTDGKTYAFMPFGDVFVQEIDLTRIANGVVRLVGERKKIVTASDEDVGLSQKADYLEGPWAMKRNGRYYLFYAALYPDALDNKKKEYWVGCAYADSPMGPWKKDPKGGKVFWGGHVAVFDGPDGRPWFSYRGEKIRETWGFLCIDPMDIDRNGRVLAPEPSIGTMTVPLKSR